jgi:hypothetical protein
MKDLSIIQKTAFCQNRKNIRDALTCVSPIFIPVKPKIGTLNIFLIQNKGKGPPGRSCGPGVEDFPDKKIKPATGNSSNKSYQVIQYQYFNLNHN